MKKHITRGTLDQFIDAVENKLDELSTSGEVDEIDSSYAIEDADNVEIVTM